MLTNTIILILSAAPISLVLISIYQRFILKFNLSIGNTTTICTPVIGTLAKKDMQVKTILIEENRFNISTGEYIELISKNQKESQKIERTTLKQQKAIQLITQVTALCHYPKLQKIETATTNFLTKCQIDIDSHEDQFKTLQTIENKTNKKLSTIVAIHKNSEDIFSFCKGHPEEILKKATRILIDGKNQALEQKTRKKLKRKIQNLNKDGQKVIAFAYKPLPRKRHQKYEESFAENDLVLIGFIGLGHLTNQKIRETITKIKELNLKTYVLGSCRERKAIGLSKELKIINTKYNESIPQSYLETLSEQKLKKLLQKPKKDLIFSELSQTQKQRIIETLKKLGHKTIEIDKNHTLSDTVKNIEKARQVSLNKNKLLSHTLITKTIQIITTLTNILFGMPLVFTISSILILEILINLPFQLSLQSEKNRGTNIIPNHFIPHAIISSIIIIATYTLSIIKLGWFPGANIPAQIPQFTQAAKLTLALIALHSTLSVFKITENITQKTKLILSLIIILAIITFTKITYLSWLILSFVLVTIYLFDKLFSLTHD